MSVWLYFLSAAFIAMGWIMTWRLTPEHRRARILRWLAEWSAKALLLPLFIWGLMNVGLSWNLQPFMPEVQIAQNAGGPWFAEWLRVTGFGLFILSSYWAAGTLGWVLASTSQGLGDEAQKDFRALCLTCAAGLGIPAVFIMLLGGWPTLGVALVIIIAPIAGYAPNIIQPAKMPPMYARAIARIKFGKYSEAEWEIIRELEKSENDFDGWMMLADLYANHFSDIPEAERTVLEMCDQPSLTPSQLSIALHRLADWQLKIAGDPDAARRALQMIADRLKGSHLARMALLRLNQLPGTADQLREQHTARPIPLPALGDSFDEQEQSPPSLDRAGAARAANACVEQLKRDPNDVATREKLARLFAEQLEACDHGLEQIRLLLNMPDQPDAKRAEWLGLTAAWHVRYRHDFESARHALERIVQEFPGSAQAFASRRRLEALASK